jgi:hypothetical protein
MYKKCLLSASLSLILLAQKAYAIDLQPGEARAPKPNINLVQYSYILSERGDQYQNGEKQNTRTSIQSSSLVVRLGRSFEFGQMPAFFYIQTPMGNIQADGFPQLNGLKTDGDTGVGDTSFAFALWPYNHHETGTYFGVGAYLTIPTGDYDRRRSFNMGENRLRTALQAGFQTQITDKTSWMLALDGVFYQDNDESFSVNPQQKNTLAQDNLYTLQTNLKYDFNPQYSVAAAYFYTVGGRTEVNGIDQHNLTQLHRYQISAQGNYSFGRLLLQYGSDLKAENGFFEDKRLILRYTTTF